MKLKLFQQRIACDGCTACCEVFALPELEKPGYSPCRHLAAPATPATPAAPDVIPVGSEGPTVSAAAPGPGAPGRGCGIHADRPRVCRDFICAYAMGLLGDSVTRRPDQSGLMLQLAPPHRLQVWEVRRGAFDDTERLTYLVRKAMAGARGEPGRRAVALFPVGSEPGPGLVDWGRFVAFEDWLVFTG